MLSAVKEKFLFPTLHVEKSCISLNHVSSQLYYMKVIITMILFVWPSNNFSSRLQLLINSSYWFPYSVQSNVILGISFERDTILGKFISLSSTPKGNKPPVRKLQVYVTALTMKFSIRDFFSKYDQIPSFLRIWSYLLKKFLMENFILFL